MPYRRTADRCPGVLRLREAADGWLARVRLPGGLVGPEQLRALAAAAVELGDGRLELTSRGNVQLRALPAGAGTELADRLHAAALLPVPHLDAARNVVASPLAGLDRGADLTALVRDLDRALLAHRYAPALSGRFLFGLDDGRGDVASLGPDLLAVVGQQAWVEGVSCRPEQVVPALMSALDAFVAECRAQGQHAWRVRDLDGGRAAVRRRFTDQVHATAPVGDAPGPAAGPVARADGGTALVVLPPLGRLTAAQAHWLAGHAEQARITPWRSVVLPHAPAADPGEVGLVTDARSPWRLVSACAGRPGCGKALADVQADAAAAVATHPPSRRVHWAGCERCCGRTADVELTMIATVGGYRVA